jgi:hypothetical protein
MQNYGGDFDMELTEIFQELIKIHKDFLEPLKVAKSSEVMQEFSGTFEVMQGKQKVQGHYFSSVLLKDKDVRFYFFPLYIHEQAFNLSEALRKQLKGKTCFHLKKIGKNELDEIRKMIGLGVELMKKDKLI